MLQLRATLRCGLARAMQAILSLHAPAEEALDLWRGSRERVAPEGVALVFYELNEGDEKPPRVRPSCQKCQRLSTGAWRNAQDAPIYDEALQQHARNLLAHNLLTGLAEEEEEHAREVVRVGVGVAQLVRHRI